MGQYLPIVLLLALAVAFAAGSFIASGLLAPRRPHDKKRAPYECGILPAKDNPERFPVRFFLIAMIFIIVDIEIIFFYPWALAHKQVGLFGLISVVIFTVALFESFVYLIGQGALEWGPVKKLRRIEAAVSPERTADSTVRRVGTEGRENEAAA